MPIYKVQAPDGRILRLEGPEGASQDQILQAAQAAYSQSPEQPQEEPSISDRFVAGAERMATSFGTGVRGIFGSQEEAATAAQTGAAEQERIQRELGPVSGFDEVAQAYKERGVLPAAGEFISQVPGAVAEQGVNILGTLGAAKLGAVAGTPFGPVGSVVGGALGAGAYLYPQMFGSNLEEQARVAQEQGQELDLDRGKAAIAATGQTAIEAAGTAFTIGGNLVRRIIGKEVAKDAAERKLLETAQESLAMSATKGAARGTSELPVEVAQEVLTRWQSGQDLLSDDAIESYGYSAYGALQVGPAVGAAASPFERRAARKTLEEQGLSPTGEAIAPATQTEERRRLLQEEQQTAEYMQQVERQELEDRRQREEAEQIKTAAELQGKVGELAKTADTITIEADGLTDRLDTLYGVKDNLQLLKQNLDRVKANTDVRKDINARLAAVNAKIKEGQDLARTIGVEPVRRARLAKDALKNLPPDLRAQASAQVFAGATPEQGILRPVGAPQLPQVEPTIVDQKLTKSELISTGLPESAGYTKQLSNLDLSIDADRTKAADIIGRAVENPRVKPEVKTALQALYQTKLAPPVAPGQTGFDFTAPEPTAPTAPVVDDAVFDSLGIGKTAIIRRNKDLRESDLNDPAQVAFVRSAFEAYRDTRGRSEETVEKINAFLDSLPEAPAQGETDVTTESIGTEPTTERPAGEPSVAVAELGSTPTAPQEGTPGGVPESGLGGLAAIDESTRPDVERGEPVSGAVVAEAPTVEAPAETKPARKPRAKKPPKTLKEVEPLEPVQELPPDPFSSAVEQLAKTTKVDEKKPLSSRAAAGKKPKVNKFQEAAEKGLNWDLPNVAQSLRAMGDSAGAVTPNLENALNSQDPRTSLQAIVDDDSAAFNDREKLVARKILDMSGPLPTMRMVDSLGVDANGNPILGQYNSITDEISLVRGAADSHTFLHEMIHAFVHRTIIDQERSGARTTAFKQLQDVFDHIKKVRPDLAEEYGMSSLTEFASEAMSNREFQMQLMGIPYKKESIFGWFARALRDMLGLNDAGPVGNTLFTSMVAVDGLMRSGRDLQVATTGTVFEGTDIVNVVAQAKQTVDTPLGQALPTTLAQVNQAPTQALRTEGRKFINTFSQGEAGYATLIRQQAVDILAPVAKKLSDAFSQGVKSSFGDVNPIAWMRQAFDHQRIALQVFRAGGLRMTKDGFWEAFDLKDNQGKPVSAQMVVEKLSELAKKEGTTYPTTKGRVATVLEGMRLKDLRDHNAKIEALARTQALSGDVDAAFETRKDKIPLHMTNAEIDALVNIFNSSPEIKDIQRIMNAVRGNVVDAMVQSGRITQDKADAWKAAVNYVPFDRLKDITENPEIVFAPGRRGIAAIARLPELQGSFERPVANTIDNFMNKIAWMTEQTMRNSAVVRTLNIMADAGMARKLGLGERPQNTHLTLKTLFENGRPVSYELQNQYDLAAFAQAPEITGTTIKLFSGASRLLRTTVTATPMFALKQVFDDAQRVMFYSGVRNPLAAMGRTLVNLPRILFARNMGANKQVMDTLERLGVVGDYDFNPINPAETIEFDAKAVSRSPVRALIHAMEKVTKASDMAARLAVYEQTMKESGDSTLAHTRARELINFNRRGASKFMRALTHIIPFFNSWAQGMDLLYRGFTGEDASSGVSQRAARNMFVSRILFMTALGTAYAMLMSDDEGYEDTSDEVRDRAWVLPKQLSDSFGMSQSFKIPVPIELGFIFKSIPERAVQYYKEHSKGEAKPAVDAALSGLRGAFEVYGMEPIPALIRPAIENLTNYSFFNKRALVPPNLQNAPKELQYTSTTSEFAKELGKQTDTSPILIDNAIRGYFGLMGTSVSMMLDAMMNPTRPDRNLNQLPFLSIGLMAPVGSRNKDDFYEFREKVASAVAGRNALETDPERQMEFTLRNQELLAAAPYVNQKVKQLRDIRAMKKMYESPVANIPTSERREIINELNRLESQLLEDVRSVRNQFMR